MKKLIEEFITKRVSDANPSIYRKPLIGYSPADDEIFTSLKTVVGEQHLLPVDLLPGAKTVLAFFVPYKKSIVDGNRSGVSASWEWAQTYACTNNLINEICRGLNELLIGHGVKMAWLFPTYNFDKEKLMADWSHKHVAYACGLGQFGRNHLLITSKGCAGRFGTAVLDVPLEPSPRPETVHACPGNKSCDFCIKKCPVGALNQAKFARHECYRQCQANDSLFPDIECVEVCGKCSTGPCAYIE
ncbi:MAG: epoxyqueuosine reductase [Firmicutes bacterium]|nr:epoxyqueuosine reductase [Bacillota bacterium]